MIKDSQLVSENVMLVFLKLCFVVTIKYAGKMKSKPIKVYANRNENRSKLNKLFWRYFTMVLKYEDQINWFGTSTTNLTKLNLLHP